MNNACVIVSYNDSDRIIDLCKTLISYNFFKYIVITDNNSKEEELKKYDQITNKDCLDKIIRFIGESEYIVTNTYHMYYWATLLKKKVILFGEFSSKFDNLKYPPVRYTGVIEEDLKNATVYEDALEESREKNREFLEKITERFLF